MKVIQFYKSETQLIKKASKQNREAQQAIYTKYAPKMLSVCRQYIKDLHNAEEVMMAGFLKVFLNIHKFKSEGSFEGWIRRIMVNESISFLRSKKELLFTEDISGYKEESWNNIYTELEVEEIQILIDNLPEGYKMVFVLYAVEGYKHSEIADMLNVSENTSKSQLFKARKMLQQQLTNLNERKNGTVKV